MVQVPLRANLPFLSHRSNMITNKWSEKMSKINYSRSIAAAAFVAAATFSLISLSSSAQASSDVMSCSGSSRVSVIDCCQKLVRIHRPLWMLDSGSSCHAAAVCTSSGGGGSTYGFAAVGAKPKKVLCYIRPKHDDRESHDNQPTHQPEPRSPTGAVN
jgi:hypothetical protein